jgi:hypothetical protein
LYELNAYYTSEKYYNKTYNVKDIWQLVVKCKICLMLLLGKSDIKLENVT